jgi:hypothetical protein
MTYNTSIKAAEAIEQARDSFLNGTRRWGKNRYYNKYAETYCALGAIRSEITRTGEIIETWELTPYAYNVWQKARKALAALSGDHRRGFSFFNDADDRTLEEVVAKMTEAANNLRNEDE